MLLVVAAAFGTVAWRWWSQPYQEVVAALLVHYDRSARVDLFTSDFLTPARFRWLRAWVTANFILCASALVVLLRYRPAARRYSSRLGRAAGRQYDGWRGFWRSLTPGQRRLVGWTLVVLTGYRVFLLVTRPPGTDEAYSFFAFVDRGAAVALAYYPIPNNHVFSNLLAAGVHYLIDDARWTMRLVPLLASTCLTVWLFRRAHHLAGFGAAYFVAVGWSWTPKVLLFATEGRGYMLMTLFAWILALGAMRMVRPPLTTKRPDAAQTLGLLWIAATALGFLTVPTFLFAYVAASAFVGGWALYERNFLLIRRLIAWTAFAAALTLWFYAPLLLTNGWEAVAGNKYVRPTGFGSLRIFITGMRPGSDVVTTGLAVLAGVVVLLRLRSLTPEARRWAWLVAATLVVPVGVILVQQRLPPIRSYLFQSPFVWLSVALSMVALRKWAMLPRWAAGVPAALFVGYCTWATERGRVHHRAGYEDYLGVVEAALPLDTPRMRVTDDHYALFVRYEFAARQRPLVLYSDTTRSYPELDLDVLPRGATPPLAGEVAYENDQVIVWRLR
ncbi:MAG: hypothetical protein WBA12_11480 [Catalinimonas sp.]